MPVIREFARAKLNLSLAVKGRRPDGYHEISSLVAFADVGDEVTLDTEGATAVSTQGLFATAIEGRNIVEAALDYLRETEPQLRLGRVEITKSLPVAAGVGGGSADAGAFLRAVRRANPDLADDVDWVRIAVNLGADVAVCLANQAAWVAEFGDKIAFLSTPLPVLSAVLVNPLAKVPADKTTRVFQHLRARRLPPGASEDVGSAPALVHRDAVIAYMREAGNDLEAAAGVVVREIAQVMSAVGTLPRVEVARLSGAGPTCFGIFPSKLTASEAAKVCAAAHPDWWVQAATVT